MYLFYLIQIHILSISFFFFFNDTATTEIYTLSLHDALPISDAPAEHFAERPGFARGAHQRSEEHTSELQSRVDLVCRLLLEKKKIIVSRVRVYKKKNNVWNQLVRGLCV